MGRFLEALKRRREGLQFFQCKRTDLVAGSAMQGQFNYAVFHRVRHCFPADRALKRFHAVLSVLYMASISLFIRAEIRSRFSLPLAVSIPLSIENASGRRQNARTCL